MKKLLALLLLMAAGTGCQFTPTTKVNHLVFTQQATAIESRPIDNPPTTIEVYYTDSAARLHLSDPTPETLELLSLFDANEEYVTFLEDNVGKEIIKVALSTQTDKSKIFFYSVVEKVLTAKPEWIDWAAKVPYTINAPYYENEIDPPITQRVTLDPSQQNISRVEIIDANNQVMEIYTVTLREQVPAKNLPADFFTLEGWTEDLPGDGYTILEDDFK